MVSLGKKENQNLSKTCHSPNKCCQRNNTKKELESEMLLVLGLSSCLKKSWEDCDLHGGEVTGQVPEPGVRANIIPGHDQKVLQELSSLSCSTNCLDKTRPWLWFPRTAASKVHFPPVQGLKAKVNNGEKAHFDHTHRNTGEPLTQDRAMACQHLPGEITIRAPFAAKYSCVANQVCFWSSLSSSHLVVCLQLPPHLQVNPCMTSRATQSLCCHSSSFLLHKQTERWQKQKMRSRGKKNDLGKGRYRGNKNNNQEEDIRHNSKGKRASSEDTEWGENLRVH